MGATHIAVELIVVGDGEVGKVPQAHLPAPDGVHDEDIGGEAERASCRGEKGMLGRGYLLDLGAPGRAVGPCGRSLL